MKNTRIVKIVNDIPFLDYRKKRDKIIARIKPFAFGEYRRDWFGALVIKGIKSSGKSLTEILKERLWLVDEKHIKGKKYFFLSPAPSNKSPTHLWVGTKENIIYKKGVRTLMKGSVVIERKKNNRYGLSIETLPIEKKGKIFEIRNLSRRRKIIQYFPNGIKMTIELKGNNFQQDTERKLSYLK